MLNACRIYSGLGPQPLYNLFTVNENGLTPFWWMSKSTTVNDYGFKPFANGGCQMADLTWNDPFVSFMRSFFRVDSPS